MSKKKIGGVFTVVGAIAAVAAATYLYLDGKKAEDGEERTSLRDEAKEDLAMLTKERSYVDLTEAAAEESAEAEGASEDHQEEEESSDDEDPDPAEEEISEEADPEPAQEAEVSAEEDPEPAQEAEVSAEEGLEPAQEAKVSEEEAPAEKAAESKETVSMESDGLKEITSEEFFSDEIEEAVEAAIDAEVEVTGEEAPKVQEEVFFQEGLNAQRVDPTDKIVGQRAGADVKKAASVKVEEQVFFDDEQ